MLWDLYSCHLAITFLILMSKDSWAWVAFGETYRGGEKGSSRGGSVQPAPGELSPPPGGARCQQLGRTVTHRSSQFRPSSLSSWESDIPAARTPLTFPPAQGSALGDRLGGQSVPSSPGSCFSPRREDAPLLSTFLGLELPPKNIHTYLSPGEVQ